MLDRNYLGKKFSSFSKKKLHTIKLVLKKKSTIGPEEE